MGPGQPARAAWRLACAPADLIQQGCGGGPEGPVLAPRAAVTRRQDWRERIVEGGRGDESEDSRESAGQASVQRGSPAGAGLKMPEPALLCEASSGWALGDSVPLTSLFDYNAPSPKPNRHCAVSCFREPRRRCLRLALALDELVAPPEGWGESAEDAGLACPGTPSGRWDSRLGVLKPRAAGGRGGCVD
ncbi:unnamed protein product [Rangifer tarandus platyrhynchus]|uniref:Uncharacterized protein n=1 Tax=Rangifer tarandus platyrhynchus TaxID=3082113 RepID=A0ABN8YB64_RANTA|nr:unnamed protein product [Rangifer tarandus platyrhynchus]